MPRSSRTTVTGPDRPGRLREPSWAGNGRRTTTTVPTKATIRTTTTRAATPRRLSRSTRRRGTVGTLTGRPGRSGDRREERRDERRRSRRRPAARFGGAAPGRRGGPDQRAQRLPVTAAVLRPGAAHRRARPPHPGRRRAADPRAPPPRPAPHPPRGRACPPVG